MKLLVLYEKAHKVGIVTEIVNKLKIKKIFYLSPFFAGEGCFTFINKLKKLIKKNKIELIILDYRPLVFASIISYANKNKIPVHFIQHGYFEVSFERKLRRRKTKWFISSIYFSLFFMFYGLNKKRSLFQRLVTIFNYFFSGSAVSIKNISKFLNLDYCFLFDSKSKKVFLNEFKGPTKKIVLSGALDSKVFFYDKNGIQIYVSQPLHQTGHVLRKNYLNYLNKRFCNYKKIYFLIHPKIEQRFISEINYPFNFISKKDLKKYKVKKIIGHFSSILMSIDRRIELILDDNIYNEKLDEVKNFSTKKTKKNSGLKIIYKLINA